MKESADKASEAGGEGDAQCKRALGAWELACAAGVAFVLSVVLGGVAYASVGATLWLFFAGLVLAALLAPALVMAEEHFRLRVLAGAGVAVGVSSVWLWAVIHSPITLGQWLVCSMGLVAWVAALMGLVMLLARVGQRLRGTGAGSAGVVVILAVLWLSWPFWLAPWLGGRESEKVAGRLVAVHPLFSINAPLRDRGFWLESAGVAYWATNLNQDVFYAPPTSLWAFALTHVAIGIAGLAAEGVFVRRKRRTGAVITAAS